MPALFKFALVGIVNTAVDFFVLNFLIIAFGAGLYGEGSFVLFKTISFLVAVANSYVLNKSWVFEFGGMRSAREPALFFIVSVLGFAVNVSISFAAFTAMTHILSPQIAANIGALAGTAAVFAWNFIGYRAVVFKKRYEY